MLMCTWAFCATPTFLLLDSILNDLKHSTIRVPFKSTLSQIVHKISIEKITLK